MDGRPRAERQSALCIGIIMMLAATVPRAQSEAPEHAVSIKVGSELSVTFVEDGNRLINPTISSDPAGTPSVVTVKLERSGAMRTLYVTNGFAKTLLCRARIHFARGKSQREMDMAAVGPQEQAVMSYRDPIEEILLFDFRLEES
jgi:hypothetical protein